MFVDYDEKINLDLLLRDYLISKECRYPLFATAVIEKMGKVNFFEQAMDISMYGLQQTESRFFKNKKNRAMFTFKNKHLITMKFIGINDKEYVLWNKYKDIPPTKENEDAYNYWLSISNIIRVVTFDYDDFVFNNCYKHKGKRWVFDYSEYHY